MPVVQCDECGKKYRVRDDLAGTEIPCKECGSDILVPGGSRSSGKGRARRPGGGRREPTAASRSQRRRNHKPSNPQTGLWIAGGVGLVLILVIVGVVISLGSKDDSDQVAGTPAGSGIPSGGSVPFSGQQPPAVPGLPNNPGIERNTRGVPGATVPGFPGSNVPGLPGSNVPGLPGVGSDGFSGGGNLIPPGSNTPPGTPPGTPAGNPATNSPRPESPPPANVPSGGNAVAGNSNPRPPVKPIKPPATGGSGFVGGQELNIRKDDPVPDRWTVAVDGPAVEFTLPEKEIVIDRPDAFASDSILYPTAPSPFVALGDNTFDKGRREIWNFATGKKTSSLTGVRLSGSKFALSPDGKYLAGLLSGGKGPRLIDLEEPRDLGELVLGYSAAFLSLVDFAGTDRVIAGTIRQPFKVWKLPGGELEREFEISKSADADSLCLSPGGRYLAFTDNSEKSLQIVELSTGAVAGSTKLPELVEFGGPRCQALLFSPDGIEIAGIFDAGSGSHFLVWNVADGKLLERIDFAQRLNSAVPQSFGYKGRRLEWFPGKKRWLLYGHAILDREVKRVVWNVPESDKTPRLVIDDQRIIGGYTEGKIKRLLTYKLDEAEVTKAAEVLMAGGTLDDAGLPTLTAASLDGMRTVDLEQPLGDWEVTADPAPAAAAPLLPKGMQLQAKGGRITNLYMSRAQAGRAAVMLVDPAQQNAKRSAGSSKSEQAPNWIEILDVAAGARLSSIPISFSAEMLAFSPGGTRVLTRIAGNGERVDLWDADQHEHIVGWRPYQADQEDDAGVVRRVGTQSSETDDTVRGAVFVDDSHVMTLNRKNTLILWKVPECRAVYTIENVANPGLSPGGAFLVISNGRNFRFFNALTGESRGVLTLVGNLQCAAFSPDGTQFAALVSNGVGQDLIAWNLAEGTVAHEFPAAVRGSHLQFCGKDHVLIDGATLLSLERKTVIWRYQIENGVWANTSPDGQFWYLTSNPRSGATYLLAVELPESRVQQVVAQQQPSPRFVIEPGTKATVLINLADPPGHPNFRSEMYRNLLEKYSANEVQVAPDQPIVISFTMQHSNTGKTEEYNIRGRFGTGGTETVQLQRVLCGVTVTQGGQTVWENSMPFTNSGGFFIRVPDGTSIEKHLTDQMWNSASNYLLNYTPPKFLFTKDAGNGLGNTVLNSQGLPRN